MIKSSEPSQDSPYYIRGKHLLFKSSRKVPLTASCGWQWTLGANTALVPPACPLLCVSLTCPEKDRQSQAPSTHSKVPWEHTFPCCNQNTNSRNPLILPSSVWDEVGWGGLPTPFLRRVKKTLHINLKLVILFSTSPSTEVKETERCISPISKQQIT